MVAKLRAHWVRRGLLGTGAVLAAIALHTTVSAAPTKKQENARSVVTYVGMRTSERGGTVIYADLSGPATLEVSGAGSNELRYRLVGSSVTLRNNTNPLLAQYFDSLVESARLVPEKDAVVLVVKLRRAVTPKHRIEQHAGGASTLLVDVPPKSGAS